MTYLIKVVELVVQVDWSLHLPIHVKGYDTGRQRPLGIGVLDLAGREGGIGPFPIILQGILDDGIRLDLEDDAKGEKDQA